MAIKWDPFELCKLLMKQFRAQVEESSEEAHDETSEEKLTIMSDETNEIESEVDNSDDDECENEPEFSGNVLCDSDYDIDVEYENEPEFSGEVHVGAKDEKRTIAIAIAAKKPIESDAGNSNNSDGECANELEVSEMYDYNSGNDSDKVRQKPSMIFRSHLGPVPQVSGRLYEAKPEAKSP